jgi:hypothetical protein
MAAGWGNETWSYQKWGLLGNELVTPSSAVISISTQPPGYGLGSWSSNTWGNPSQLSVTGELNAGYGIGFWGQSGWGAIGDAFLTGQTLAFQNNFAGINVTTTVEQGWGRRDWGEQVWGDSDEAGAVTGQQLNSALGTPTIIEEINTGWGRLTYGENAWGIFGQTQLEGQQLQNNIGSVSVSGEINIGWGRLTWGERDWGTSTLSVQLTVTGQELTPAIGTEIARAGATVELSTLSNPGWGQSIGWGQQLWGTAVVDMFLSTAEGTVDPAPDAEVTGEERSFSIGDETVTGTGNTDITGIDLDITTGTAVLEAVTFANVSGIELNLVNASVVAGTSALASVSGIDIDASNGILFGNTWNEIDPNVSMVWTEIAA